MPRAGLSRAAVTSAALEVVDARGASGFADLTLAAVASRVGVAVPSLYKHVSSLADLKRDVAIAALGELHAVTTSATIGRAGPEALAELAAAMRRYAHEHPGRYVSTQIAPNPDDPADDALRAAANATVVTIAGVLRGFGLESRDEIDAIRVVRSALHGFFVLELGGGFGLPDDVDITFARLVDTVVLGVERFATLSDRAQAEPVADAAG